MPGDTTEQRQKPLTHKEWVKRAKEIRAQVDIYKDIDIGKLARQGARRAREERDREANQENILHGKERKFLKLLAVSVLILTVTGIYFVFIA